MFRERTYLEGSNNIAHLFLGTRRPDIAGLDQCGDCYLHPGFLSRAEPVITHVKPILENLAKDRKCRLQVLAVGHSLGGAVAEIIGTSFANLGLALDVSLVTFAAPRVGSPSWAAYVNEAFGDGQNSTHFVHRDDIVPHLRLQEMPGYGFDEFEHFENELWITDKTNIVGCSGDEDANCSDSEEDNLFLKVWLLVTAFALSETELSGSDPYGSVAQRIADGFLNAHSMTNMYSF